jgi:glycerophosphoryl diester phosphodiesterase
VSPGRAQILAAGLVWLGVQAASAGPLVIAHRGGMAHRPENSMAAFLHAASVGVKVIEFDMVITADDRVVIHHDLAVNRAICRGDLSPALIRTLTFEQVRRFDCGSTPHPAMAGQKTVPGSRILELDEMLSALAPRGVEFLGETKMDRDDSPHFVPPRKFIDLVLPVLRRHGIERRFILQSGDPRTLIEMKRQTPEIRTCLVNTRRFQGRYVEAARQAQAGCLMIHHDFVSAKEIGDLRAQRIQVFSSTANDTAAWRRYLELGFDGILTDDPEGLLAFLARTR